MTPDAAAQWRAITEVLQLLPATPTTLDSAIERLDAQARSMAEGLSLGDAGPSIEALIQRNAELELAVKIMRAGLSVLELAESARHDPEKPLGSDPETVVPDPALIPAADIVATVSVGGNAKRTSRDSHQPSHGGRKPAKVALHDLVAIQLACSTHDWILVFTNKGRVYRARAFQLPEAGVDAPGVPLGTLFGLQPDETAVHMLATPDYAAADYLVLATRRGLVKKTRLSEYDSARQGGIIAINLADDDELISARLVADTDDLLMVSRKGMSVRFTVSDETLRPMGRATSGLVGMRLRGDDALLAMDVVRPDTFVVTITDGGFTKRTPVGNWATKGRGILGVRAMKLVEERSSLVGAMVCEGSDQLFAIASNGAVMRTRVDQVRVCGRDTMGVALMNLAAGDAVVSAVAVTDLSATPGSGHSGQ